MQSKLPICVAVVCKGCHREAQGNHEVLLTQAWERSLSFLSDKRPFAAVFARFPGMQACIMQITKLQVQRPQNHRRQPPMKFCTADVLACGMIGHVAASTGCLSTGRYQAAMYALTEHA